ncbi:MAG: hypothetical protein QMC73_13975 [Myxococcota bacterium]|jgi:hypothetical protein
MGEQRGPRFATRFGPRVSAAQASASVLGETAFSGARVDESSIKPEVGSQARIFIFV